MDFARKHLEKYGWSNGKGLGKHENGISEPLKPKLKRSVAGIGHDAAADFTEHWWKTLYDKAASNVEVEEKNGKTKKIKTKDNSDFEITNSTWKLNRKTNKQVNTEEQYADYFVKKSILTSGGSKTEKVNGADSENEEETEKKDVFNMTDEELFAACEGRTAHKGARHGLKATGKLARIEQQEKLLLNEAKYKGYSHTKKNKKDNISECDLKVVEDLNLDSDVDTSGRIKKKKKKIYHIERNSNDVGMEDINKELASKKSNKRKDVVMEADVYEELASNKSKNKRNDVVMADVNEELASKKRNDVVMEADAYEELASKKSKKKRKRPDNNGENVTQEVLEKTESIIINHDNLNTTEEKPKKRKKNTINELEKSTNSNEVVTKRKKSKKNRVDL